MPTPRKVGQGRSANYWYLGVALNCPRRREDRETSLSSFKPTVSKGTVFQYYHPESAHTLPAELAFARTSVTKVTAEQSWTGYSLLDRERVGSREVLAGIKALVVNFARSHCTCPPSQHKDCHGKHWEPCLTIQLSN